MISDLTENNTIHQLAQNVVGDTNIPISNTYLTSDYEIEIISQVVGADGLYHRFTKRVLGNNLFSSNRSCSFFDGAYANASYNEWCQWIVTSAGVLKLASLFINGNNVLSNAQTFVFARKISNTTV